MLQWVDNELQVHEEFMGLYEVSTIEATFLVAAVKNCLLGLNISLTKVRGQCYDGASNMSGLRQGSSNCHSGRTANAYFTHCYGHNLNLAVADTVKYEESKYSRHRQGAFNKLKDEMSPGNPGVHVSCPTRWTVPANSIEIIVHNSSVFQELLD